MGAALLVRQQPAHRLRHLPPHPARELLAVAGQPVQLGAQRRERALFEDGDVERGRQGRLRRGASTRRGRARNAATASAAATPGTR
jgi:hypothetical protein